MLPRIRFPSFSGHYTEKSIHDAVLELKSGLSRMFSDSDIGLPVIRSNNIKDYCLDFNELKYWFEKDTQGATTSNYHLRDGDILVNFINSQAQIGKSAIYYNTLNRNCIYTTNILSLRINKDYSPEFIFFFFQTKTYDDYIQSITKPAVNQASFTTKDFRKMKIFFPDLNEQTKIANFLCSVDEKIALLNKQYNLLFQYKKGMMQKIFSQEVRFKDDDGTAFPDWENQKLGDVAVFLKGKGVAKTDVVEYGERECIRYGELYTDYGDVISKIKSKTNQSLTDSILSMSRDVLIPSSGETAIDISKASCVLSDGVILGGDLNIIRSKVIDGMFLSYYINSQKKYEIAQMAQGNSVVHLYAKQLAKTEIFYPCKKEQTKIANFLSSLDDKIAAKKAELDKLKTWKQGLLQQMFI